MNGWMPMPMGWDVSERMGWMRCDAMDVRREWGDARRLSAAMMMSVDRSVSVADRQPRKKLDNNGRVRER